RQEDCEPTWAAFTPDGTALVVYETGGLRLRSRASGAVLRTVTRELSAKDRQALTPIIRLAMAPDGKTVAYADWPNSRLGLCDLATGHLCWLASGSRKIRIN